MNYTETSFTPARVTALVAGLACALVTVTAPAAPQLAAPDKVPLRDEFCRSDLGAAWKTNDALKKAPGQSRIAEGTLVISMAAHSDHGAVITAPVEFTNAVITCRFRLADDKGFNLPINDNANKDVHAGHICR